MQRVLLIDARVLSVLIFMSSSPFSRLPSPKPDPLFAIGAEAQAAGPSAINGTLGIFMDEQGHPLVFPSVKKALSRLGKNIENFNYSYPPLTGLPDYRKAVTRLITTEEHTASIASTGGTGALAINLQLMKMMLPHEPSVMLPVPAWGNHLPVCLYAGLHPIEAPYIEKGTASIDGVISVIRKQKKAFGILLQVGCHNPTGLDYTDEQWTVLLDELAKKQCIVLLDIAYQGFKGTVGEDIVPIQMSRSRGITTLVTWSASKNHSIYGLRTGLALAFVESEQEKKTVEGTYSSISRGLHSAAPTFGQAIVAFVQEHAKEQWENDLLAARTVLVSKRRRMMKHLPDVFHKALSGYGMFAMLPLSVTQVNKLKHEHHVFILLDGRINIGGIPEARIRELCGKIVAVL